MNELIVHYARHQIEISIGSFQASRDVIEVRNKQKFERNYWIYLPNVNCYHIYTIFKITTKHSGKISYSVTIQTWQYGHEDDRWHKHNVLSGCHLGIGEGLPTEINNVRYDFWYCYDYLETGCSLSSEICMDIELQCFITVQLSIMLGESSPMISLLNSSKSTCDSANRLTG